jgi:hypothetical protein
MTRKRVTPTQDMDAAQSLHYASEGKPGTTVGQPAERLASELADGAHWLREGMICACGRRHCPELRIGAMLPETAPSEAAWEIRARHSDYPMHWSSPQATRASCAFGKQGRSHGTDVTPHHV